jgi:DNA-directed RNA polymerase specialized sigma24 family protein
VSDTSSQPGWVSIAEAARTLGISETAVRKRIRAGTLPARGERGAT